MLLDRYSRTIDLIYAAASGAIAWDQPLVATSDLCGMANCALVRVKPGIGATATAPHADPEVTQAYSNRWWALDPTVPVTRRARIGSFTTLKDTGHETFTRSEFHNEFWKRSGLGVDRIHTNILIDGEARATLVLQDTARRNEIDAAAFQLFASLQPHFVQALAIQRRLMRLELAHATADRALVRGASSVFAVDRSGKWVPADDSISPETGELALRSGLLRLDRGVITLDDAAAADRLSALIESCARAGSTVRGGSLTISGPAQRAVMRIEVEPWTAGLNGLRTTDPRAPVALLVVHDLQGRASALADLLQDRYGLTGAEARVAVEMASGDGREAAAARLGISVSTARTHLSRIYEKTETTRQAELVALLSSLT